MLRVFHDSWLCSQKQRALWFLCVFNVIEGGFGVFCYSCQSCCESGPGASRNMGNSTGNGICVRCPLLLCWLQVCCWWGSCSGTSQWWLTGCTLTTDGLPRWGTSPWPSSWPEQVSAWILRSASLFFFTIYYLCWWFRSKLMPSSMHLRMLSVYKAHGVFVRVCMDSCVVRLWGSWNRCVCVWPLVRASSRRAPQLWSPTSSWVCPGCGASSSGKHNAAHQHSALNFLPNNMLCVTFTVKDTQAKTLQDLYELIKI